jgi:WD40 repeat protein
MFSPDGQRIVTSSEDKTARIWDAASGKAIGEPLKGHQALVHGASFRPDGKRIVTASWDKTARIWHAASGKAIAVLRGHDEAVASAAFPRRSAHHHRISGQDGEDLGRLPRH